MGFDHYVSTNLQPFKMMGPYLAGSGALSDARIGNTEVAPGKLHKQKLPEMKFLPMEVVLLKVEKYRSASRGGPGLVNPLVRCSSRYSHRVANLVEEIP